MTSRMRRGRSDWADWQAMSARKREQQHITQLALAQGVDALTDEQRAILESQDTPRAKPVQHEDAEIDLLTIEAARCWWWPGYTRLEHRTHDARRASKLSRGGVKAGIPDVLIAIPARECIIESEKTEWRAGKVALLEMKAAHHRPAGMLLDGWWLESWDTSSKHRVTREQRFWLRLLAQGGADTFVAFGAMEALNWIRNWAGARPVRYAAGWEDWDAASD